MIYFSVFLSAFSLGKQPRVLNPCCPIIGGTVPEDASKAWVLNIRLGDQNWHSKDFNLARWTALENAKEGLYV